TSDAFWSLARSTGTRTPKSSVVITIVTIAAMLGAALRRMARKASATQKKKRPIYLVLEAGEVVAVDAHLGAHAGGELLGRLVLVVAARVLVGDPGRRPERARAV